MILDNTIAFPGLVSYCAKGASLAPLKFGVPHWLGNGYIA